MTDQIPSPTNQEDESLPEHSKLPDTERISNIVGQLQQVKERQSIQDYGELDPDEIDDAMSSEGILQLRELSQLISGEQSGKATPEQEKFIGLMELYARHEDATSSLDKLDSLYGRIDETNVDDIISEIDDIEKPIPAHTIAERKRLVAVHSRARLFLKSYAGDTDYLDALRPNLDKLQSAGLELQRTGKVPSAIELDGLPNKLRLETELFEFLGRACDQIKAEREYPRDSSGNLKEDAIAAARAQIASLNNKS